MKRLACLVAASLLLTAGSVSAFSARTRFEKPLGELAYEKALWALEHSSKVHYRHNKNQPPDQITESERDGSVLAAVDNTGFVSWVLYRTSPDRLWIVEKLQPGVECPDPANFARFLATLPSDKPTNGWAAVGSVYDLRRGDVIAWTNEKSAEKRKTTGHVMLVSDRPGAIEQATVAGRTLRFVSVRVIDSSPTAHFGPEVLPPLAEQKKRDGLGEGYVRLILNEQGLPVEHWDDPSSEPVRGSIIGFGRLVGPANFPKIRSTDLNFEKKDKHGNVYRVVD